MVVTYALKFYRNFDFFDAVTEEKKNYGKPYCKCENNIYIYISILQRRIRDYKLLSTRITYIIYPF